MDRDVIYESDRVKVIQCGSSYELHKVSTRVLDGWLDTGWNLQETYGDWYSRDWLGRTAEYRTKHNPRYDALVSAKTIDGTLDVTLFKAIKWLEVKLMIDREVLEPEEIAELEETIEGLKERI